MWRVCSVSADSPGVRSGISPLNQRSRSTSSMLVDESTVDAAKPKMARSATTGHMVLDADTASQEPVLGTVLYASTSAGSATSIWVQLVGPVPLRRGAIVQLEPSGGEGSEALPKVQWRVSDESGKLLEAVDGRPHGILDEVSDSAVGGIVKVLQ